MDHEQPTGASTAARWGILAGVVLTALTVHLLWRTWPALAPNSLWLDDAWAALVVRADDPGEALRTTVTAPGWTLLLSAWLRALGFGETAAQTPAVVFAVLAVPMTWAAVRRLVPDARAVAVAATSVVATSPLLIAYAARVKPYTLDVLLSALVIWLAARTVDDGSPDRRRWELTAGALAAVSLSASVVGVATAVVGLVALQAWRSERHLFATRPAVTFVLGAGIWWLVILRQTIPDGMREFWASRFLDLGDPATSASRFVDGGQNALATLSPLPVLATLALAAAGIALGTRALRRAGEATRLRTELLLGVAVLPWLVSLGLAVVQRAPWGGGRTDSALLVSTAVAIALVTLPTGSRPGPSAWLSAVVAVACLATATSASYPVEDLRTVVAAVEATAEPGEVVAVHSAARWGWALYTTGDIDLVDDEVEANGFAPAIGGPPGTGPRVVLLRTVGKGGEQDLRGSLSPAPRGVWLVLSHDRAEHTEVLRDVLRSLGYGATERITAEGARAERWEPSA